MIQIITNTYKDKDHMYENGFIHSRVLEYINHGIETEVFVLNSKKTPCEYVFEGVKVIVGDQDKLYNVLKKNDKATICVHFLTTSIVSVFNRIKEKRNIALFVHGVEALKWYERIFPGIFTNIKSALSFGKYILSNSIVIPTLAKFMRSTSHNITCITVSNWMKEKAEKNWRCKGKYNWHIIPNIINNDVFLFREKNQEASKKLLSIRPFSTGKYANDITVKCVRQLIDNFHCNDLDITIVGRGTLYNKTVKPLKSIENVNLVNRFLNTNEIVEYHGLNGVFICPTRQDAQGVSMCEAMSSGLVPITLYNTAIPEYLPDDSRLICRNVDEMVNLVLYLINNPEEYLKLSKKCSDFIKEKCDYNATVRKEIELFNQLENI